MRFFFPPLLLIFLAACTMPSDQDPPLRDSTPVSRLGDRDSNEAKQIEPATEAGLPQDQVPIKPPPRLKSPAGLYLGRIPSTKGMEQVILFQPDHSFRFQQTYSGDSTITTTGTWSPSDGYIWLYKEGVAIARYTWKQDSLQFLDPETKKTVSLVPTQDIASQPAWQSRKGSDTRLFVTGTEPFWSLELMKNDSLILTDANLSAPISFRKTASNQRGDSLLIEGKNDSSTVQLVVLNQFCSDGMSDFIYPRKVSVTLGNRKLKGCGMIYQ